MSAPPAFHVLIPARMASTRLPRKPMADIGGVPMVVRVAQQASRAGAQQVVVAADDIDIINACTRHGVQSLLTRSDHASGSDRLAEACALLGLYGDDLVVNVQGDEPLIEPSLIAACAQALHESRDCVMSTAAHELHDRADWLSPHVVKVVADRANRALYFSRAPIPWWRDPPADAPPLAQPAPLRHIGIYAYRAAFLRGFSQLEPSPLEAIESLEQLRALWHGHRIVVHRTAMAPPPGVDTPEDLARVQAAWNATSSAGPHKRGA